MKATLKGLFFVLFPLFLGVLSLSIGRFEVDFTVQVQILLSQFMDIEQTWTDMEEAAVIQLRLPRVILAILIGGGLSIAGAALQGMFANPLVSLTFSGFLLVQVLGRLLGSCYSVTDFPLKLLR